MATALKPPAAEAPSAPGVHPKPLLELQAPLRPRGGRRDRLQLHAALVPGEGLQALARLELLLLARHDQRRAAAAARGLGPAADVPVRALGRARLRLGQGHRVGGHVRLVDPLGPPPLRPPDGRGGVPAPGARVPDRRLQERRRARPAPRVELGDGRRDAAADALPLLHRLPAALGPAGVLGGHRRHQHRRLDPVRRPAGAGAADRRPRHRPADAACASTCCTSSCCPASWARSSATTCGACARTAAWRASTAWRPAREGGRGRGPHQDLHAARRRPRHRPAGPRRDARGARPHGERRPRPRAPRRGRGARHLRRDQRAVLAHPLAARGGGQRRSSPRTRPRRPGTSSGCRRSSPTRPSPWAASP